MIYLGASCTTRDGESHSMANVLPLKFAMTDRLVNFGYVTATVSKDCLIGATGATLRGHSFHYSCISGQSLPETAYDLHYSLTGKRENEGFLHKGVLASYVHLHFGSNPEVAERFVNSTRAFSVTLS
jgi:cobyrinic acid a,c-diamide synthase